MHSFRLAALTLAAALASAAAPPLNVIPRPATVESLPGEFRLDSHVRLTVPAGDAEAERIATLFADQISGATGFHLSVVSEPRHSSKGRLIELRRAAASASSPEAYDLRVDPRHVVIEAFGGAGLFYGTQTLRQLLPPEIESPGPQTAAWVVPAIHIVDAPRFGWRGLMLDVSRHFFTKDYVKSYIDRMAEYKLNVLHWHLSDDEGWRVEIKSLPRLTEVGAWRVPRTADWGKRAEPQRGEAATDGGFYTQDDIREVVKYAADRYVRVMPEIDIPGHSLAAIASYPELSCTGLQYWVDPGAHFYTKVDNALCPGREETFQFVEKVVKEIAGLFPSEYIHLGGDECYKGFWQMCPRCQRRMADEHLKNEEELQSYFFRRVEKIVEANGKKLIGWDEILEGGLAPDAAVMSWRGLEGGITAARMQHLVVMTPTKYSYLDYAQGDFTLEPPIYATLLLKTAYSFEPVPPGVDPKYILGGQGNLWTEHVPHTRALEYMTWPRAMAIAEVYWSPAQARDWNDFARRTEVHFARLDEAGINHAPSLFDVNATPSLDSAGQLQVALSTELEGRQIYYTLDGTIPDSHLTLAGSAPILIPDGVSMVRAQAWHGGKPEGRLLSVPTADLKKRLKE